MVLRWSDDRPSHPAIRASSTPRGVDAAKQRIFLAALVECGSATLAARAAGMSRASANRLRIRLAGTPFDRDWQHCLTMYAARLADPLRADGAPVARK